MTEPTPDPGTRGVEETPPAAEEPGDETLETTEVEEPEEPEQQAAPTPAARDDAQAARRELDWYRQNYDVLLQQYQARQRELDEYETAAMSDDERAQWELRRQREALEIQQQEWAEKQYAADLYTYYQQFVDPTVIQGNTPSDWQASVLTHLQGEIVRLQAEVQRLQTQNAKLKQASAPGRTAPPVTTSRASSSGRRPLGDYTWQELETMKEQIVDGTLSPEDLPGVASEE